MTTDLYTEFFGMTERPFTLLPDPDFLFWSKGHRRAYSVLEYGVMARAPITVVTGEVGAGKTTLVQALIKILPDDTVVGLLSNTSGGGRDMLRWVLNALDIPAGSDEDYVTLHQRLNDFVIEQYSDHRHVVLIIDEAQNLSVAALEELRMLTNINSNKDELLQLILVGQPELRETILRPDLSQFSQRVSATYHIHPMDLDTTREYIEHRLRHAGGSGREFTTAAIYRIFNETQGVPRMINKLCDLAMVYAAGAEQGTVTVDIIQELLDDGVFVNPLKPSPLLLGNRVDTPRVIAK